MLLRFRARIAVSSTSGVTIPVLEAFEERPTLAQSQLADTAFAAQSLA